MDDIIPGISIPILIRINQIPKEMRILVARSELTTINIESHSDCTDRVNQRREELLHFLLWSRSPGHDAFIIYVKLLLVSVEESLDDLKAQRKEEEGVGEVDLNKDCGFEKRLCVVNFSNLVLLCTKQVQGFVYNGFQ